MCTWFTGIVTLLFDVRRPHLPFVRCVSLWNLEKTCQVLYLRLVQCLLSHRWHWHMRKRSFHGFNRWNFGHLYYAEKEHSSGGGGKRRRMETTPSMMCCKMQGNKPEFISWNSTDYPSLPAICETPFGDLVLPRQWNSFSTFYYVYSFLCGCTSYQVHFQRVGDSASRDTRP